jgi:hypothetical protein
MFPGGTAMSMFDDIHQIRIDADAGKAGLTSVAASLDAAVALLKAMAIDVRKIADAVVPGPVVGMTVQPETPVNRT